MLTSTQLTPGLGAPLQIARARDLGAVENVVGIGIQPGGELAATMTAIRPCGFDSEGDQAVAARRAVRAGGAVAAVRAVAPVADKAARSLLRKIEHAVRIAVNTNADLLAFRRAVYSCGLDAHLHQRRQSSDAGGPGGPIGAIAHVLRAGHFGALEQAVGVDIEPCTDAAATTGAVDTDGFAAQRHEYRCAAHDEWVSSIGHVTPAPSGADKRDSAQRKKPIRQQFHKHRFKVATE